MRALEGLNLSGFGRSVRIPLSRRGLLEVHLHGTTLMMNAVAVGGTSLVNSALMQRPAGAFFDALPRGADGRRARAALPGRRAGPLGSAPGPADESNRQVLAALAKDRKWKLTRAPQAIRWESDDASRPACIRCNRCMVGCNVGAKQSLDLTLIPRALDAGAVLRDLCTVQTIEPIEGGYAVRFRDAQHATHRDLAGAARGPRGGYAQHAEDPVPIECRRRPRRRSASSASTLRWGPTRSASTALPRDVAPSAIDGHRADWVLEVPDAEGDREFAFGDAHASALPSKLRCCAARRGGERCRWSDSGATRWTGAWSGTVGASSCATRRRP